MHTTYTFHDARDHRIIDTATPETLQLAAAEVAETLHRGRPVDTDDTTHRVYVHNGKGVVAAGLCRGGSWHDVLRDNYREFDEAARTRRAALGLPNDPHQ